MWMCPAHASWRHLGANSIFIPFGSRDQTRAIRFDSSAFTHLYPLSHFTSPKPIFEHKISLVFLALVPGRPWFQELMETGWWKPVSCQASCVVHLVLLSQPSCSSFSLPFASAPAPGREKEREIWNQLLKCKPAQQTKTWKNERAPQQVGTACLDGPLEFHKGLACGCEAGSPQYFTLDA